jgi:hypothetical protein
VISELWLTRGHHKSSIAYSFATFGTAEIFGYTNMRFPCREELTLCYYIIHLKNSSRMKTRVIAYQAYMLDEPLLVNAIFDKNAKHAKAEKRVRKHNEWKYGGKPVACSRI